MSKKLKKLQNSQLAAHILPFFCFMLFILIIPIVKNNNSLKPWWLYQPEHWLYPLQIITCTVLLIFFRKNYQLKCIKLAPLAVILAIIGIIIWVTPALLHKIYKIGDKIDPQAAQYLGLVERNQGFNPFIFKNKITIWLTIFLRFVRMAIIVPFVEEILWRGFLMRYLVNQEKPFWQQPIGKYTHLSFWATCLFFTLAHHKTDWLAAAIYGILCGFLCIKSKSLTSCILMHSIANLLLGIFILKTKMWGFW